MKKHCIVTFIAIATALWISAPAWALQDSGDRITVPWSDPSRPGLLKVNLQNGRISVMAHSGKDVIIGQTGRGRNPNPPPGAGGLRRIDANAPLVVEEENNVMTVTTRNFSRSGDLEIQVPEKTNLTLKSVNGGNILIDGVEGEIEVSNDNGNVTLTNVAGSVVAHSMNGRVTASVRQVTANKPMAFTSMNGNVDVTLPTTIKATMKMRTDNGEIYSDFDLQLATGTRPIVAESRNRGGRYRIEIDRSMTGTVNGGGPDLDLRTFNGNIYIRKGAK